MVASVDRLSTLCFLWQGCHRPWKGREPTGTGDRRPKASITSKTIEASGVLHFVQSDRVERSTGPSGPLPAPRGIRQHFASTNQRNTGWRTICSVWKPRALCHRPAEFRASRKPLFVLRFAGSLLLRFAVRQFAASLFQLPPRSTRFWPLMTVHQQAF